MFIVSFPNVFTIFFAVAGPIPLKLLFAKYFSNASGVDGIIFSNVAIFSCSPYSGCVTISPVNLRLSPLFMNGK